MKKLQLLCFAALLASAAAPLSAQVSLEKADWQFSRRVEKKNLPFENVATLAAKPNEKLDGRLMALVAVKNSGAKPVEALVLRYSLAMRLYKQGEPAGAAWVVPFHIEEVRVSKLKAGETRQVKLIHANLGEQIRKLRNTGFWFDAIRINIIAGPRAGDELARVALEAALPVTER